MSTGLKICRAASDRPKAASDTNIRLTRLMTKNQPGLSRTLIFLTF